VGILFTYSQTCSGNGLLPFLITKVSTFSGIHLKITIFGLTISSSWGNGHATPYRALLRALHRMGHDVVFYERDVPYYARRRDFSSCDFCRLILYSEWDQVRSRALSDCRDSDVIINSSYCSEGATICDDTLALSGSLHVFYDLDTPITLEKLASQNTQYLRAEQVPEFDLYLSWCGGEILQELETRWHAQSARPLYGCVDPAVHARVDVPDQYRCLMSYMGTYAADRQHKFEQLFLEAVKSRPTDTFVLAGSQYPQHEWPANLRHFDHVSPQDHPALYSSSRFTLNLTRDGMARGGYCPSGRLFEAAACGTPIITDWFTGLDHFFTPREEILIVNSAEDVLQALDTPDEEVSEIAARARERTLAEHTGDRRAQELVSYLESATSRRKSSAIAEVA
jgi:spore maturation protein CgeB